ncbi:MAG: hypothetical protein PW788_06935 [Micavibrio sp.]|nr:hypothetical protein [Micavibrio sp.]
MDNSLYYLSRIYGKQGVKAQKYALVDPSALPFGLKIWLNAYRIALSTILLSATLGLIDFQVWSLCLGAALVAGGFALKYILEKLLDRELEPYLRRR